MNFKARRLIAPLVGALMVFCSLVSAQVADQPDGNIAGIPVNYTEAKVGQYTLADPLKLSSGQPVTDAATWTEKRRPEIIKMFEDEQFGRAPGKPDDLSFDVFDQATPALGTAATRRQVTIYFTKDKSAGPRMDLLIYLPAHATGPVPLLLNISFSPNNLTVADDPGIKVGQSWNAQQKKRVPTTQGRTFGTLPVADLIAKGFGVATFNYADVDPDALGAISSGIRAVYLKPGQTEPAPDEWGAIAAWAWGISRAVDYLQTDPQVDAKRIAIMGVSRLGKTVMWAGAQDTRIAAVIASCSGEGGAALSSRNYGETIAHLVAPSRYPYQFCANYAKRAAHPEQSDIDGHMLIALIAPRAVLLQTGSTDYWSDPKGEFLAAVAAEPVFKLLGKDGLGTDVMPGAKQPILHTIGYYMHEGGHGTLPGDWDTFEKFLQMHLKP